MTGTTSTAFPVPIAELGECLAPLRLCEPIAVEAMQQALTRHGQLTSVIVFDEGGGLQVIDGFKRLQAARRLGWRDLRVARCGADIVSAIVQIAALHTARGLTELEEGWVVRALYRDHGLAQAAIAERLGRHKSWVCRRLLLVEALDPEVQARLRLGLLAPRAAVALAGLPRGNQTAASDVVIRRGLTVHQTELFVGQLLGCEDGPARASLLTRWASGDLAPAKPGPPPSRSMRSDADWLVSDVATLQRIAGRVQARLIAAPLLALGPTAAELVAQSLELLGPMLTALLRTIATVTTSRSHLEPDSKERAA